MVSEKSTQETSQADSQIKCPGIHVGLRFASLPLKLFI